MIVWCLPHMGFVEKEEPQPTREPAQAINNTMGIGAQVNNTIPAGSSTVSSVINEPAGITLPNNIGGFNNNNSNDAGFNR